MIWLVMLFVTVVSGFIQAAVVPVALLGQAKLPLLLAVVIYYSLNHDMGSAAVAALLCGVLHDVLGMVPIGQTAAIFLLIALVSGRFRKLVHGEEVLTAGLFGGLSAFVSIFAGHHLLMRVGLLDISTGALWHKALGYLLLGAIASPIVFLIVHRLDSLVGNVATSEVIEDVLD